MKKFILMTLESICNRLRGKTLVNGNTYYWGKGFRCILVLAALLSIGCLGMQSRQQEEMRQLYLYNGVYYAPNGCEYYVYNNNHSGIPVHKQDCKKCAERRKQEMKELIYELKKL